MTPRRTLAIAALLALFAPAALSAQAPGAEGAADARELARKMQGFYDATKDYQAAFTQTYTDLAAGEKKVSAGRVYIKKPGMMRWDYVSSANGKTKPQKVMVSNGKEFWIYEYEFKQAFKECMATAKLPNSMSFLMGEGDLLKSFEVAFAPGHSASSPALEFTPKEPTSHYKALRFALDPKTFQVVRTTIFDPYGNTNEIAFAKARTNRGLKDKSFAFQVPKNARLLNPNNNCS